MIERTNGRRKHAADELEGRRLAAHFDGREEAPAEPDHEPTPERLTREIVREALGFALFVAVVLAGIIALELLTGTGGLTTGAR